MALYSITANVNKVNEEGWNVNRQIPTFYLDSDVQGITDAGHACGIARSILDPWAEYTVNVYAQNVDNFNDNLSQSYDKA